MTRLPKRTRAQKIGSRGHRWAMAAIEANSNWLARSLDEDFGIDAEAEYIPGEARGDILKLQFKSTERAIVRNDRVRVQVEARYAEYARACRYPVVLVHIDVESAQAWYLWLQEWLLNDKFERSSTAGQGSVVAWVSIHNTLNAGLNGPLRDIARWRGSTQLALSLMDALRAAGAIGHRDAINAIVDLLENALPSAPDAALNAVVDDAMVLGERLRGTPEGYDVATKLLRLVRAFGSRMSLAGVDAMVRRGDSYSRTGIDALAILYDDHYEHAKALELVSHFRDAIGLSPVAYYCALREAHPSRKAFSFMSDPGEFQHSGLRFDHDAIDPGGLMDKFANRGSSALLDYLISAP